MSSKTRDKVTIAAKNSTTSREQTDLESYAKGAADYLDKMPKTGDKVAGYLVAHSVKGDYDKTRNPVVAFVKMMTYLPSKLKVRAVVDNYAYPSIAELQIESDSFTAKIPLPEGAKAFLKSFNEGFHDELYSYGGC